MFNPTRFYKTTDSALAPFARPQTWAKWRHTGTGPKYLKAGRTVLYSGKDLNDWLQSRTVAPKG